MMLRYLGFAARRSWSGAAAEDDEMDDALAAMPAGTDDDEEDEVAKIPEGHIALYDPDLRMVTGSRPQQASAKRRKRKAATEAPQPKTRTVNPAKIKPTPAAEAPERRGRKVRLI
jgi:hypothetical protein